MPPSPDDLRVLVVASDPLARAGLATLLATQTGCAVVGQVDGSVGRDWTAELGIFNPDVLLWDFGWDPDDGTIVATLTELQEAVEALTDHDADSRIAPVLVLLPDDSLAVDVWAAGGRCLLPRDAEAGRLVAALNATDDGLVTLAPEVAAPLLPAESPPEAPPSEALTAREMEVLQLLAEGLSNRAIALRLGISDHTVKFHVNAILSKLDAQSRTEAVVRASRLGLIIL